MYLNRNYSSVKMVLNIDSKLGVCKIYIKFLDRQVNWFFFKIRLAFRNDLLWTTLSAVHHGEYLIFYSYVRMAMILFLLHSNFSMLYSIMFGKNL